MKNIVYTLLMGLFITTFSCSIEKYQLPGAGSIPDATPPEASFSATQGEGLEEEWRDYLFSNLSSSATMYEWNFGDGNTSTEVEPVNTYPGEGTFTVSLTATDALGVSDVYMEDIVIVEPEAPAILDPVLVNADFNKIPKSSGSDCACSGWINKSVGDQGESSSGNGGSDNVLKFDNNEPDHIYQEFEVVPNAEYTMTLVSSFKSPAGGDFPSMLEVRVLSGSGYAEGYTPTYYAEAVEFPQDDFGYTSVSQLEDASNNLLSDAVISNPNDEGYFTYVYTFNAGANDSVALFMRGIGGPATGGGGGDFGYNSGDEEIRLDSVTIIANQ